MKKKVKAFPQCAHQAGTFDILKPIRIFFLKKMMCSGALCPALTILVLSVEVVIAIGDGHLFPSRDVLDHLQADHVALLLHHLAVWRAVVVDKADGAADNQAIF